MKAGRVLDWIERVGDRLPEGLWEEYRALVERLAGESSADNDRAPSKVALTG